jgi:hypothetical protein
MHVRRNLVGVALGHHDRPVTIADEHVAQLGAVLDRLDAAEAISVEEGLPECARETLALSRALQPVILVIMKLGAGPAPGVDASEDVSWAAVVALARRDVVAQQAAGIDKGLTGDCLRLLARIDALIGQGPGDGWNDAVQVRVKELVEARQQGALRGRELRRSRQETDARDWPTVVWLLRHPEDYWLRQAVQGVADAACKLLIESLIAKLQPSYDQMCGLDLAAEEAAAELICEAEIVEVSPGRWKEPASAVVTVAIKGNTVADQQIAIRLVEDPDAQFNGTIVSLLAGERWRICAREFKDGTLLPLDGTRRYAVASL